MALAKYNFFRSSQSGFSLVETLIASAILATALVSLAELFGIAVKANATAKNGGMTMILAEQKMEQLRGLTWGFDAVGVPLTDTTTDTAKVPEAATGGTGLSPSPENTIQGNTDGYVDYVDTNGRSLGGGTVVPMNTAYIRRWSVEPLPTNPNNTVILQVLVTRRTDRGVADAGSVARLPDEARLVGVKTRKTQ
jgi:prepilin-type N-terminal cleavage/methylation domain-containing protein